MQLIINSYGSYLHKQGNCFLIENKDRKFEVSVKKVESIMITTSAAISTDAIKFAMDNNIDVVGWFTFFHYFPFSLHYTRNGYQLRRN
ncbi:MAG: CRISPR-associated endonuclease Cas1 [bacterium]|nr:CRISPR-associated endonuclease Cas1 [bacterium]